MILLGGQSSGTRDTRTGANVLMHLTLPARASLLREEVEPAAEQVRRARLFEVDAYWRYLQADHSRIAYNEASGDAWIE